MISPVLKANSQLEIALLQSVADSFTSNEIYIWLVNSGLPNEIAIELHELLAYTQKSEKKVFAVGKIILIRIIEFVEANRNLVQGIGIGLTIGLIIQYLVTSIPLIGCLLAPVIGSFASKLGIIILGFAGHRLDRTSQDKKVSNSFISITEEALEIVTDFFRLIADVFNVIFTQAVAA